MPELNTPLALLTLTALAAYLLGSVPFGILISRIMGLGDLRSIGSGNIGATNVLRTGNRLAAVATLILDAGKGTAAVLVARALIGADAAQLAGLAAFLGHLYPIYLRFRGGKGVATFIGTALALAWPVGLAVCASWLVAARLWRYSSLAGMVGAASAPIWGLILGRSEMAALLVVLAILVILRHRDNIARLRAGTEARIGGK
jgi:glycerol-3-phosphate acyltransferase PlsY